MTRGVLLLSLVYAGSMAALVLIALHARRVQTRALALIVALATLAVLWTWGERTLFWAVPAWLAAVAVLSVLIVPIRDRRVRALAILLTLGALASLRVLSDSLEQRGWNNVGGHVDCWPSCSGWHLLGSGLHHGPAVVGVGFVLVVVVSELLRRDAASRPSRSHVTSP